MQPEHLSSKLVSVIIPAHNAERTLDRTLASVRGQTHDKLEIIVADDASTDETASIAEGHAARDNRVRLIGNAACKGVGGARNRGAAAASGEYLCFIDADDLMAPHAVGARLQRLHDASAEMCYAWNAEIDEDDMVVRFNQRPIANGNLFEDLVRYGNFLVNGSSVVVTRRAFDAVNGYSEVLFAAGYQGCEDYQFYLEVARRFPIACCEDVVIGYRKSPDNMSGNTVRMMKSFDMVQMEMVKNDPRLASMARIARGKFQFYLGARCLMESRFREGFRLLWPLHFNVIRYFLLNLKTLVRDRLHSTGGLQLGSVFPYAAASRTAS